MAQTETLGILEDIESLVSDKLQVVTLSFSFPLILPFWRSTEIFLGLLQRFYIHELHGARSFFLTLNFECFVKFPSFFANFFGLVEIVVLGRGK